MRVVICGGGVIGACTALYLRRHGIDVIVVERTEVAAAASGKAGGFLARDCRRRSLATGAIGR
jgi:glycine/D-amino acid oxidase-like deaminating enzyme